jgi:hypothetical protein
MRLCSIASIALLSFCAGRGDASSLLVSVGPGHSTDHLGLSSHDRGGAACYDAAWGAALKCCGESEIGCRVSRRGVNKNASSAESVGDF